jgi:hypothetical protein
MDGHERRRDLLGEPEIARRLEAARKGRHGVGDHLLRLMMYRRGCGSASLFPCAVPMSISAKRL